MYNNFRLTGIFTDLHTKKYKYISEKGLYIIKAETHNHPTAISPHAGAATGSGGELRDGVQLELVLCLK